MKIACVATGWYPESPGGLEKYVYGLTRALLDAGNAIDLFVTREAPGNAGETSIFSIGSPSAPLWRRMLDARRAFARNFRPPYDVVNIHFALNALPLLPFIDHSAARVVHFHGPWGAESRAEGGGAGPAAIKEALERFVYHRSDRFVVLSGAFKEILAGYGVDRARISVIPMGIDCSFFRECADRCALRAELGWSGDAPVFFTARRLIHRVGLMELLEAARMLRTKHADFTLKVAGKGPLREQLEQRIAELDLSGCVELLGFVSENDLVRAYQAADVTVLPSQSLEGFGTVIGESLACGTPVIVTPVGGMPEAIAPLGENLIARSASAADIAERMSAFLGGTLELPSRAACRAYASNSFDWPIVASRVRAAFGPN